MTSYTQKVKTAGRRLTRVRQTILSHLQGQQEPRTAAAIHQELAGERVDLASVYRTLELLERLGVVSREQRGASAAYVLTDHHHHHIVCRSCRRQACWPCALKISAPPGFRVVRHQVVLTGVCASCALVT